jgi:hypothetical protein
MKLKKILFIDKTVLFGLWITAMIFLFCSQGFAATLYVATSGKDSGNCQSSDCASINYALSQIYSGDTIEVKPGNYNIGGNYININDTTSHSNITITAFNTSNRPVITGSSSAAQVIYIAPNVTGVTISYLEVVHNSGGRLTSSKPGNINIKGEGATIDHCIIRNGYHGVGIRTGRNITVSNNIIHTIGKLETNPDVAQGDGHGVVINNFDNFTPASGWNEKIYVYNNEIYDAGGDGIQSNARNFEYIEIASNKVHDNYEDGLDWKDAVNVRIHDNEIYNNWGNGIGSNNTYPSSNFEIWNNRIYNNGWYGISVQGGSNNQSNWKIWNNLIYGNVSNPPKWNPTGVSLSGTGHEFYYNVVYNNDPNGLRTGKAVSAGTATVKNNIIYDHGGSGNSLDGRGVIQNNYVYPATGNIGSNAITSSNPMLADEGAGDFQLLSGSPLINAALDVGITTDFQGNLRPAGGGYDIGAYEFGGVQGDTVAPAPPANLQVVLN